MQDPTPQTMWRLLLAELRRRIHLAPDWREIMKRAWSVRLLALSFFFNVLGIVFSVVGMLGVQESPWRSIGLQALGAAFSLAAIVARPLYQPGLSRE